MRSDQGSATIDSFTTIGLEGIGGIIQPDAEQHHQKAVEEPVQYQLERRVIDRKASLDETAAENTVVSLVQLAPVAHNIVGIVRPVGHHDHHGIAVDPIKPGNDCPPESVRTNILHRTQLGQAPGALLQKLPGTIGAAVVNDDDLVRNRVEQQHGMQRFYRGADALLLVSGRNHD